VRSMEKKDGPFVRGGGLSGEGLGGLLKAGNFRGKRKTNTY